MFEIRKDQVTRFEAEAIRRYERRVIAHLRKCFPSKFEGVAEVDLRKFVQEGMRTGAAYGFSTERELCLFVDITARYGPDFHRNQALPWAKAILVEPNEEPADKIDRLFSAALAATDPNYPKELLAIECEPL